MYFQSFGAVSIVKVNANWFHVTERGGFSGVFGTMIASGIFLAFTGNAIVAQAGAGRRAAPRRRWGWSGSCSRSRARSWAVIFVVELFLLRDRPSEAGQRDFDTGDASSGDTSDTPIPTLELFKRIFTNRVIMTIALIEFCTGVLRNGVMHWFPIYATEIWALPSEHGLQGGILLSAIRDWSWRSLWPALPCFAVAAVSATLAARTQGRRRGLYAVASALAFLAPFLAGGWGGVLMVAGVIGGNVAGWVSDLIFQSRRGPAAGFFYAFLILCALGMAATLGVPTNVVESADVKSGLVAGDRILAIAGKDAHGWKDVRDAVACMPPTCKDSGWDPVRCLCASELHGKPAEPGSATITARVERNGQISDLALPDPKPVQRAGDMRLLKARPQLPLSPYWMGVMVFLLSLSVIGTHGVLSGTATMDFGGRKGAATAVGVIDGFVYLGTSLQSVALGYLTTRNWAYWPWFLLPFGVVGFLLCLKIWHAKPTAHGAH